MTDSIIYPWLRSVADSLEAQRERGQLSHAILLQGPAGTGRRFLALWLAARILGARTPGAELAPVPGGPVDPDGRFTHPDFVLVQPPGDKRTIPVDRIREMISFLQLTAHQGGAKVALLSPAQAMSPQAANSLLKTLEEPPAGCNLLLVAEHLSRLPPTVVSRCQRVRIPLPKAAELRAWRGGDAAEDWSQALALAGGAPLLASRLLDEGFPAEVGRMEADLRGLCAKQTSPASVARRWNRLDPGLCLDWLYRRTAVEIRARCGVEPELRTAHLQIPAEDGNMAGLFASLGEIGELRRLQGSGINGELHLARLLDRWYGGPAATR